MKRSVAYFGLEEYYYTNLHFFLGGGEGGREKERERETFICGMHLDFYQIDT